MAICWSGVVVYYTLIDRDDGAIGKSVSVGANFKECKLPDEDLALKGMKLLPRWFEGLALDHDVKVEVVRSGDNETPSISTFML